jgi:hypothetical protein
MAWARSPTTTMSSCPRAARNWSGGTAASATRASWCCGSTARRRPRPSCSSTRGRGWAPVVLHDGTVSDGKVETYEKAVAEILCPADTFFTSVFSAQGKRPLSAFKNAEIKTLLADLLGLEQVRQQGALAADVVKQLKAGLAWSGRDCAGPGGRGGHAAQPRRARRCVTGLACGNGPTNFDSREVGRCAPEAGHGHRRAHWRRRD